MAAYGRDADDEEKEDRRYSKMSTAQLKEELNVKLRAALIEEIKKLPQTVQDATDHAAASILMLALGLDKDSWNHSWRLRSNAKSPLFEQLEKLALERIELNIPQFIESLAAPPPKVVPWKKLFQKGYQEALATQTRRILRDTVEKNAHAHAQKLVDTLAKEAGLSPVDYQEDA